MPEFGMTEQQMIDELAKLMEQPEPGSDGWMTSREVAEALGVPHKAGRDLLRRAGREGRLEALNVRRMSDLGCWYNVRAYRIRPPTDGQEAEKHAGPGEAG